MFKISNNNIYVIMYHYVRPIRDSDFKNLKGLEYNIFKKQINNLIKNFNILTNDDFFEIINSKKIPIKPSILLTFDDGYKDHYDYVYPYLLKKKISGIFYPPTKIINNNKVLEVNKIHFILEKVKNINILLDDSILYLKKNHIETFKKINFKKISLNSRFDSRETVLFKKLLQSYLPKKIKTKIINYLFKKYTDLSERELSSILYFDKKEMKEMFKDKMIFGSHGCNHVRWNLLNNNDLNNEIYESIKFFKKNKLFDYNFSISYPYGGYNKKVISAVKNYDVKFCLTTEVDSVNISNINDKFILPRYDTNDFLP